MIPDSFGVPEPDRDRFKFSQGQRVRIVDGPFTQYIGTMSESNSEQQKVTVLISLFGKHTPVILDFLQVEKIAPFSP